MSRRIEIKVDDELVLKEFILEDSQELFDLIDRNRGQLSQFGDETSQKYPNLDSVRISILNPSNPQKLRFGIRFNNLELVGTINLTPRDQENKCIEVGYYLGEEFERKRIVTRCVRKIVEYSFRNLNYKTICATVHPKNEKSQRVLRNVGFQVDKEKSQELGNLYFYISKN